MEADVNGHRRNMWLRSQQGFSMVEMLVAAFIMAIGILGLTMLQTLSIRTNASSRSRTTAIQVADRFMDQAEALGRNSLLVARSKETPPTTISPDYFGSAIITRYANYDGTTSTEASYFTVTIQPTDVATEYAGIGGIKLLTITVSWKESSSSANTLIDRNVVISRRISYATTAVS